MKVLDDSTAPSATGASFAYDPAYQRDMFDIPWDAWAADYHMKVLAPMRLVKAVLPTMIKLKSGAIITISGTEAGQPRPSFL